MLRKLVLCCLSIYGGIVFADNIKSPQDALMKGVINGHIGAFFQQSTKQDPTYGDLNMSLAYQSQRFMGYKVGAEAWLVPRLYQGKTGDFDRAQDLFVFTKLYGDFYNQYEKFKMTLGRYEINEQWITHNTEGLSLSYDKLDNISLKFVWAFRNAYVENYYLSGFRKMYGWAGAILFQGDIQIPNAPVKIKPYLYFAPGVFISPGIDVDLHLPLKSGIYFDSHIYLLSYVADKKYYGASGSSGLVWLEGLVGLGNMQGGLGLSTVGGGQGANRIDAFGQHTPFERATGMFYGNSTTIYGFASADITNYAKIYGALRGSFINGKSVFNWEAKVNFTPIKGVELGISILGMANQTDAIGYFNDTKNYIMGRGFVQYKF
ncbi:outer membrane family protein [Helicobacter cappadocius]|uniref:Outer membrane family protein n=1 Tax=Helicobacter cappadocius TaxID=3063998 RepID=A0AA90PI27_9HELI|nr:MULTISPECIES: outer membrane family protein [unclassified Helicobacter]MDO7253787.1 outer membrane family protein [Helicobacter sp. faydin-H75]MDP2538667.1 outer membrane family protein [Helicobacter sp. faydin-H76]